VSRIYESARMKKMRDMKLQPLILCPIYAVDRSDIAYPWIRRITEVTIVVAVIEACERNGH
jgi:hypothetical protein